jgi:hypothetical protein
MVGLASVIVGLFLLDIVYGLIGGGALVMATGVFLMTDPVKQS